MITAAYCLTMARYNAWQNRAMRQAMERLSAEELTRDRGAFFGSILGTANHVLWADQMWLSRLSDMDKPQVSIAQSPQICPTLPAWSADRFRMDGRFILWSERLKALDLAGDLSWYSGSLKANVKRPMGLVVAHVFNHQTHHRGQIHAMLTAAGARTEDTDLFALPDAGPWL